MAKISSSTVEIQEEVFRPHLYQRRILNSDKRVLLMCAGEQGGKTLTGAVWLHREMDKYKEPVNFIVGAPTYKIMEQSTRPTFMKLATGHLGEWDGKDDAFRLKTGGAVYFRSSTDPDSIVGIPDCVGAWLDELGKCSRAFYMNITSRLARLGGRVLGTTTPYALNFVKREIIDPSERKERDDTCYVRFSSAENPAYPREEFERLRKILPHRIFRMRLEGFHDKAEGLVFEDFGDQNWTETFPKQTTEMYGGLDWGFDHPMAMTIRAVSPAKTITVAIFKKSGLSVSQQIDLIVARSKLWGVKAWYCGHDRPEMISELNSKGIRAFKYFEHAPDYREVNTGNAKHAELIRSGAYQIVKGIDQWQDLEDEYQTYSWDTNEKDGERKVREKPVALNDDLMAAERYVTIGTYHLLTTTIPKSQLPLGTVIDTFKPTKQNKDRWDAW